MISKKSLVEVFGKEAGLVVREAMTAPVDTLIEKYPVADRVNRQAYSYATPLQIRMAVINAAIGGYGVEGFEERGTQVEYVNMGDSYSPTILHITKKNRKPRFVLDTWADVIERLERG